MKSISFKPWLIMAPLLAAGAVLGQEAPDRPASPASSAATAPAFTYRSALQDYQRFADEKQVPWQQSNETVRQIGGWRAYAREAATTDAASPGADAPGRASPPPGSQP